MAQFVRWVGNLSTPGPAINNTTQQAIADVPWRFGIAGYVAGLGAVTNKGTVTPVSGEGRFSDGQVMRWYDLAGEVGTAKIDMRMIGSATEVWGSFQVNVAAGGSSGKTALASELKQAYDDGLLQFAKGFENARHLFLMPLTGAKFEGLPVEYSPELATALLRLANIAPLQIMRTFAPRNSFHGVQETKRWVCSCMDIMRYGSHLYEWHVPAKSLIAGVAKLIRDLPSGAKYDFGFVRPVGGQTGSSPKDDVFFEVSTPEQIAGGFKGSARLQSELLPGAKPDIAASLATKNVGFVYADGPDHMHIRAYAA